MIPRLSAAPGALATAIGVAVAVSACAASAPGSPPPPSPSASQPGSGLELSSPDFTDGGPLPANSGHSTGNVSPALQWRGVPAGTRALTVICRDEDARGFVHWVLVNIDPVATGIGAGEVPAGSVPGRNDFGTIGWGGPQPPSGTHHYVITLYASPRALDVPTGVRASRVEGLLASDTSTSATIVGTFQAGQ